MVGKISQATGVFLLTILLFLVVPSIALGEDGRSHTSPIGGSGGITNPLGGGPEQTITDVLVKIVNWMLSLVGIVALIALITGGARMIMDFGSAEQVKKGKATILWAVIGLLVVILSYAIINIVTSEILGGGTSQDATTLYNDGPLPR